MQGELAANGVEAPGPRLVVVGGSSADGFGIPEQRSYATAWARELDLPLSLHVKFGVRARDTCDLLQDACVTDQDVVVLHIGLVDGSLILPRGVRKLIQPLKRGRGDLSAVDSDRRMYSRARRRLADVADRSLTRLGGSLRLLRPVQSPYEVRGHYVRVEGLLASFEGLLVFILSERAPSGHGKRRRPQDEYRQALYEALYVKRLDRHLPTVLIDLSGLLSDEHYLDDGFHPNEQGHQLIAAAGVRAFRSASTQPRQAG